MMGINKFILLMFMTIGVSCSENHQNTPGNEDSDESSLQANATIISFSAEKCGCCWGWRILFEGDTLYSEDTVIADKVGYSITKPVDVFVEFGELDHKCSRGTTFKRYYNIDLIKSK